MKLAALLVVTLATVVVVSGDPVPAEHPEDITVPDSVTDVGYYRTDIIKSLQANTTLKRELAKALVAAKKSLARNRARLANVQLKGAKSAVLGDPTIDAIPIIGDFVKSGEALYDSASHLFDALTVAFS